MDQIKHYETIAGLFADSMQLPFREAIEKHTLRSLAGDISGARVLDMACGDGFYTRWAKRAGASAALGVDISAAMIRLAEEAEKRSPLGCDYQQSDVAGTILSDPVDLIIAVYSLGYARDSEQLLQFCKACCDALREGGRFVGLNDNVRNPPAAGISWAQYGLERFCESPPSEGGSVRYRITNPDGRQFEVENFYLERETYEGAFQAAGFREFNWVDVIVKPAERDNPFWNHFLANPPIVGFSALK